MADTFSTDAIDQTRYRNEVRRVLVEWLRWYLDADFSELWAEWASSGNSGVDVYGRDPGLKPGSTLARPLVVLGDGAEDLMQTVLDDGAGGTVPGTYSTITLSVECLTDVGTGRQITCDDLVGAMQQIAQGYYADLSDAGLTFLDFVPGETAREDVAGKTFWHNTAQLRVDLAILGKQVS